jgi:type I restriction enzyme S subunit
VSESWSISTLSDVLEKIIGGGTPSRSVKEYYTGKIPWATVKDMYSTKLLDTLEHITKSAVANSSTNVIPRNNVVIATRMAVGKCFITMVDMAINQDLKALIPKKNILISEYLLYWIQNNKSKLEKMGTGTTVKGIQLDQIRSMIIHLPTIIEQRKIADILTSIDKAIEKTEAIIAQTKTVKKGFMQQLLTKGIGHTRFKQTEIGEIPEEWGLVSLGYFVKVQGGYAFKSSEFREDGIQLVRISNLYGKRLNLEKNPVFVDENYMKEYEKFVLKSGDLIICMTGTVGKEDYGHVVRISRDVPPLLLNQRVGRIQLIEDDKCDSLFLYYLLSSRIFLDVIYSIGSGSKQANLSSKQIESVKIPKVPLKEQKKIAVILSAIDNKITIEQQKLTQLQTIKKGLMQVLLTGKVRVKLDQPEEVVQ